LRPAHVFAKPATEDAELEIAALLQGRWRFALRLVMIWLSLRGLTASEIAALFEYDSHTVRRWINRYNEEGVAGLEDRRRSGAPRLGSAGLGRRIRMLLTEPRAWTVKQLRRRLVYPAMSLATLARRVREQASWRRPRLVAKGDPDEAAVLAALHQEIEALPEGAVLLAEDESHVNLLPRLRSTWIVRGERQEVMTPGKNEKHSVFGAIELATGRWLYHIAKRANSATFIEFLELILDAYPAAPIIAIVPDNVITHSSRAVQRWLARHGRLKLLYGARYCPHHNPVERVWGAMKRHLANSPVLTMMDRLEEVHAFFRSRTRAQMLATAAPSIRPGYRRVTDRSCRRLLSPAARGNRRPRAPRAL
jgi:transposase